MRSHHNDEEREASRILDLVRAGGDVPDSVVTRSLWILGDLVSNSTPEPARFSDETRNRKLAERTIFMAQNTARNMMAGEL